MATTPLRFAIKFVICFAILMGTFEATRGSAFEQLLVGDLILRPAVHAINTLGRSEHAHLAGRVIVSPGSSLRVTRGCEGIEMFILLIAAIFAFPASVKGRIQGLFLGAILAYVLSIMRLVALHYVLRHSPAAWEALHGLILPLGPLILMVLFFMKWSAASVRSATFHSPNHAT